ncbi:B3 domain-containing transcription repressor VAL2-like isoform X2 [Mangifera indica]|uniref:B3 domain-containing transcription repressor VAL2-like isoform X2 n=1 Tax=Mangifera indica TaxID=29780 RepID=UPI001CFC0F77|nr:B3 domain-containing transcription repressor VAL2-like isoform X2 [Mangifera indica]
MESRSCMNEVCGAATSAEWRKGWALRSGVFAVLCDNCGSAFEQSMFCDVFHSKESGWRECTQCGKRLHCGCIASKSLIELLDNGGVSCLNCARKPGLDSMVGDDKPNGFGTIKADNASDLQSMSVNNQVGGSVEKMKLMQLGSTSNGVGLRRLLQFQGNDPDESFGQMKLEEAAKPDISKANMGAEDIYESLDQTNLSISLGSSGGNSNARHSVFDEKEHTKSSSVIQQGTRARHLLPKPPKLSLSTGSDANVGIPQIRVARPPVEGRGRSQLLPRYWPRITEQELQQISGDSNSTIVPLFEKVLSASDAGRIGRLVLPKACAEAYFPPISQPEGLPLTIQDVKGKEWVFQFRFWPNNNSRMYVLEGITPCIQNMQLQAGDTVTFSRMDPEGKLVMGFRKASNSIAIQDTQPPAIPNGSHSSESFFSSVFENLSMISGYSGVLQSLKGSTDPHLNTLSKNLNSTPGDINWLKSERYEDKTRESLLLPSMLVPERKRSRNIGSKSKRLLMDRLDALEIKLTWEEAQDMLRPPLSVMPSIITIEDHVFEEYEEPPVFGKRSIFVVRSNGGQEQWTQCDSCSKWRRLPVYVLLPPKWTCVDNAWDQTRCLCSAPDELTPGELENLLRLNRDFKRWRLATSRKLNQENEPSGLDALSNRAILGQNMGDLATAPVATTTKHPRHRPGCSCIVCIQPPSGKGKHKPTCTCNVCMTVKRRFKTLMMNKKKRQSEREAEVAQRNQPTWAPKEEAEAEVDSNSNEARSANELESKSQSNNKGQIDLNCRPDREEGTRTGSNHRVSMMRLVQVATLPLENYLKQNGLTSLVSEQQTSTTSQAPHQATRESDGRGNELTSATQEPESEGEDNCGQIPNDPQ